LAVSRRQRLIDLLSLYIDFILVNALVALANFAIGKSLGYLGGVGMAYFIEMGLSGALVGLARLLGLSVGRPLLTYARTEADAPVRKRLWPNLLLGTLLTLDGLKHAVRWTLFDATLPVFGMLETTPLKVTASLAIGGLSACAGLMLLAFAPAAKRVALASIAASAASLLLSWSVLPDGIKQATLARRTYQRRPITEGEIDFLQASMSYVAVAGLVLMLALIYLCRTKDER
jgi:hypothetical protein